MSSTSNIRSGSWRRLIRAIALLFLVHTAIDITSPELCRGEAAWLGLAAESSSPLNRDANAPFDASENQGANGPGELPSDGDECFCCCTHVLPGIVIASIVVTDLRSPATFLEYLSLPSPPLDRAFHPPRFA